MTRTPLLSHRTAAEIVAYRGAQAIDAGTFLRDVKLLAQRLPDSRHMLNVCADRYHFAVGLAACLATQRVSLLPSTHTSEVIGQLRRFAPDAFCLTDDARCDIALPQLLYVDPEQAAATDFDVPQLADDQLAAYVFTSGSTGVPLPHPKRWGALARCVVAGARQLRLLDGAKHTLVGTVPAQHMYGFESSLLLALLSGNAFEASRPFYPADIAAAVQAVPRPRVLVTTPIHLRTLIASEIKFPPVELVMSATAPLTQPLARQVEEAFGTVLEEIYGSTETGQIALRRSAQSIEWNLWPGVRLIQEGESTFAEGGHIESRTPLNDVIEILDDQRFLLHGRTADLVNVAGKRSSFGYLNAQLNAIPGVVDGAFFLRSDAAGDTAITRLGAVVVAPGMSVAALNEQLRQRIDPVFLPRPLLMVERLPRNATGKLPQQALGVFAEQHLRSAGIS